MENNPALENTDSPDSVDQAVIDLVLRFVDEQVRPQASRIETENSIPESLLHEAARLGLYGMAIPEAYGGLGLNVSTRAAIHRVLGRSPFGFASHFSVHSGIGCEALLQLGNPALRDKWLPGMADGSVIGCFALTEPEAGSDVGGLRTRAEKKGNQWLLNGCKHFITNFAEAGLYTVIARTSDDRSRGLTAFVVPAGTPGLRIGQRFGTLGHRGADIGEILFEDCSIPDTHRLGEEGEGLRALNLSLLAGRVFVGSRCTGAASLALRLALDYAQTRKTFGKPLARHQHLSFQLADAAARIEAAWAVCRNAASALDTGKGRARLSSSAKLLAADALWQTADLAYQILGGYAYIAGESEIERIWRDARVTRIYDGSDEMQMHIIARELAAGDLP